jgi:hypothetical protein
MLKPLHSPGNRWTSPFAMDRLPPESVLFQTGYLTIREVSQLGPPDILPWQLYDFPAMLNDCVYINFPYMIVFYLCRCYVQYKYEAGISLTMVLPAKVPLKNKKYLICLFYSVLPNSVSRDTFPQDLAKKLPRYPVPVFLLAQLAVHSTNNNTGRSLLPPGKLTLCEKALSRI